MFFIWIEYFFFCRYIALNGKKLLMINDNTMPSVTPVQQQFTSSLNIPPLTFGYWVFPNANAKACIWYLGLYFLIILILVPTCHIQGPAVCALVLIYKYPGIYSIDFFIDREIVYLIHCNYGDPNNTNEIMVILVITLKFTLPYIQTYGKIIQFDWVTRSYRVNHEPLLKEFHFMHVIKQWNLTITVYLIKCLLLIQIAINIKTKNVAVVFV